MKFAFHANRMAMAAAVALVLSACGGGSDSPSPAAAPPIGAAPPAATAAPPAVTAAPPPGLVSGSPESVGFSSQGLSGVRQALDQLVNAKGANPPGATAFVARHGKIVLDTISNGNDLHGGKPLAADTIYRVYSMSKPVTAVAMLMLYEKGLWKLDDPIDKFLPELDYRKLQVYQSTDSSGKPITVPALRSPTMKELMTHTAGFAYGLAKSTPYSPVDDMYFAAGLFKQTSRRAFLDTLASLPLASQPGTLWQYSVAVDLQGIIIERLSGKTLDQFMAENIFKPLKMVDTGFNLPESKRSRLASLYAPTADGKGVELSGGPAPFDLMEGVLFTDPPPMPSGGGGLVSTTADYARFAQMLLSGGQLEGVRILSSDSVKLMMTNQITPTQALVLNMGVPGVGFGLNGYVLIDPAKTATGQGLGTYGWGGAAGTTFWVDPGNDLFVLGMMQVLGWSGHLETTLGPKVYGALIDKSQ